MQSGRRYYILAMAILVISAGWIWLSRDEIQAGETTDISIAHPGFPAPDFRIFSLENEALTLSELKGQPVLMNVWASWCLPCRSEMPVIEQIFQEYSGQGLKILAVNATNQDDLVNVRNFIEEKGLSFPIFLDTDGQISNLYQVRSLPTSFFIDRQGKINDVIVGEMSEALIRIKVEKLLAEQVRP